ncbi:hypothetical protein [Providencia rustigianii]|uniref:hypothetical protein n=1 Tax=Providencia rustigianii TaxID=158850 RepID=UPI0038B3A722
MDKNEIRVLISYVKGMIADNNEPEKKVIIALCNELERITDLEPVGYIDSAESIDLEHGRACYLYKDCIDKINIPLYRLDK